MKLIAIAIFTVGLAIVANIWHDYIAAFFSCVGAVSFFCVD